MVSSDSFSHRVEVLSSGFWGPVCRFMWDIQDANVVCRQLGYSEAIAVASVWQEATEICLGDVQCMGNERSILQCRHGGWMSTSFLEDDQTSGAICSPTGNFYIQLTNNHFICQQKEIELITALKKIT